METAVSRTKVLIMRKWSEPEIKVTVTNDEIGVEMGLSDFLKSVALQVGNPTLLFTKVGLSERLQTAADEVIRLMKNETAKVI